MIRDCIKILFNSDYAENERVMAGCFLGIYTCFIGMAIIAIAAMITVATAQTNEETGWGYHYGGTLIRYEIDNIYINGRSGSGDNSNFLDLSYCNMEYNNCDIIGAFVERDGEEICLGGSFVRSSSTLPTTIDVNAAIYINDECILGCDSLLEGEIPYFKIYDHTSDVISNLEGMPDVPYSQDNLLINVNEAWTFFDEMQGDMNNDVILNILDVVILVNEVLED
jgi:hypothetical protein